LQLQEEWNTAQGTTVSLALTPELKRISDAIERHPLMDSLFVITPGCKPYQVGKGIPKQTTGIVNAKPFTSEVKQDKEFRPLLRGRLINKYEILWSENLWIKFGNWLAEPRLSANYDAPEKIVVRQTGDSLIAALDREQFIVMNNMFTIVPKNSGNSLPFVLAALNSSVLNWYYQTCINPERGEALAEIKKGHLTRLRIAMPTEAQLDIFATLVNLVMFAKQKEENVHSAFLEYLINACVMECYFREHMTERKLLFLDELVPHLANYDAKASETNQREFLENLYRTLNMPKAKIRNQLIRISASSPELLGVILKEGKV